MGNDMAIIVDLRRETTNTVVSLKVPVEVMDCLDGGFDSWLESIWEWCYDEVGVEWVPFNYRVMNQEQYNEAIGCE